MSRGQDILAVLRGLRIVGEASFKLKEGYIKHQWANSSVRDVIENTIKSLKDCSSKFSSNPTEELRKFQELLKESVERTAVVAEGIKQLAVTNIPYSPQSDVKTVGKSSEAQTILDAANLDISSITLKELENLLAQHGKNREISLRVDKAKDSAKDVERKSKQNYKPITEKDNNYEKDEVFVEHFMKTLTGTGTVSKQKLHTSESTTIELPELSSVAKQRKVPSSRIGRMASFGGLFAGLGLGTVNELAKGALGFGGSQSVKEAFFSPANAERIVDTLCKVRGAALKLGQILSIQDSTIISPQLVKAFERVRQAADYMPDWQVQKALSSELGSNWRERLKYFDDKPFAAASIGQVHRGILTDGMEVAVKIQYPGIAQSIESDIDNLVGMLKVWDVFPAGFFIDNVVKVAKRELNWEVDYTREAEYTEKYGEMVMPYPEYRVPKVIKSLTTRSILTTELVPGVPLDKCLELSYDDRKFIAESVLKLCLRELFVFQCMQTDPNWSNFLYDKKAKQLMLIDFGSTRFYARNFIQNYKSVIKAAANNDFEKVLAYSRDMGFLTGYETKQMEEAHVNAVMILGEIFRYPGEFDFGKQDTTKRIATLVPTMVAHRLCPPPEEIYSIHRKLSGVFLLCARLNIKLDCRPFYEDIVNK